MFSAENCFKVQVAAGGPPGGAHACDDLPHLHGIPCADGDGLKVVVRGDQPVAVVNFHAVPAAPGVPAGGPDYAGVGCVDPGAAAGAEILAQVEVPECPGNRADAEPKRRTRREHFKRRHEGALGRALELGGSHIQRNTPALGHRPDYRTAERDKGPAVYQDCGAQAGKAYMANASGRHCDAWRAWRGSREPHSKKSCRCDRTRGQCARSD
jgi:hypothetical protein